MLLVQSYLRSGKSFSDLTREHGVHVNVTNNKLSLNYDQIDSKPSDLLARQCRGLVLENESFDILACPMFRFFNYGEYYAANVDFSTAKILSKVDGTCIIVYHDKIRWHCATRSRAEADQIVGSFKLSFADLVDKAAVALGFKDLQDLMKDAIKTYTYVFELTTPCNTVVIHHIDYNLHLLAIRDNLTLQELDPNLHSPNKALSTPAEYSFSSFKEVLDFVQSMKPSEIKEYEGVVVRDVNFNRVKVKNELYLLKDKLKDGAIRSSRGLLEATLRGQLDDLSAMIDPELYKEAVRKQIVISDLFRHVRDVFASLKDIDNQKEFAAKAVITVWPDMLFLMRKSGKDVLELIMSNTNPDGSLKHSTLDNLELKIQAYQNSVK